MQNGHATWPLGDECHAFVTTSSSCWLGVFRALGLGLGLGPKNLGYKIIIYFLCVICNIHMQFTLIKYIITHYTQKFLQTKYQF